MGPLLGIISILHGNLTSGGPLTTETLDHVRTPSTYVRMGREKRSVKQTQTFVLGGDKKVMEGGDGGVKTDGVRWRKEKQEDVFPRMDGEEEEGWILLIQKKEE